MKNISTFVIALLIVGLFYIALPEKGYSGIAIPVDWNDATVTPGDLDGITVTLTGFLVLGPDVQNLSGPDYSAAPLSASTEVAEYETGSDWTATFSEPVENLLLYIVFWRGVAGGENPVTYSFNHPFTVLSGLSNSTVSNGDTVLSIPDNVFEDGIIQFDGPITSLTVDTNSDSGNNQGLTFGLLDSPPIIITSVPTLSEGSLLAMVVVLGIIGCIFVRKRQTT